MREKNKISQNILELANFVSVSKEKYNPASGKDFLCVELEHIDKETGILNGHTRSLLQASIKNRFYKGDVLFGKLRPNLRKYAQPDFDGVCSTEIWVLNTDPKKCSKDFLFYLIQSERFIQTACKTTGSKMPRADWEFLSQEPFYLPPLAEQKKIAAILRTWDDAIEKAEQVKEKKARLWKGQRALALFELGKKFGFSDIGEATSAIVGGGTPSRSIEKYWNGNIPWVSVKDMVAPVLSDTQEHISEIALKESASNLIPAYTPIVSTRMAVGRTVYFTVDVAINQDLKACVPKKEYNPRFLFHCLRSLEGKMASFGTGSTVNGITLDVLREQIIPNPDTNHQLSFVALADSRENEINLIEKKINLLKSQKRGLMQKLLTGAWPVQADSSEEPSNKKEKKHA